MQQLKRKANNSLSHIKIIIFNQNNERHPSAIKTNFYDLKDIVCRFVLGLFIDLRPWLKKRLRS